MRYYSTNDKTAFVSLREAVLKGLPDDNGLFMPESIPNIPEDVQRQFPFWNLTEIASYVSQRFLDGDLPDSVIREIAEGAINFDAPLVQLDDNLHVLELFHGPTLAFKDFGARFMARLMAWLVRGDNQKLTILVATSGDTGGAVASGFLGLEGIEVIILYPSGKVSPLQEKQLTTFGQNITALEIEGNFDDCQHLVKQAFLDKDLQSQCRLTSANSINISRLIPQTFYYFHAATRPQLKKKPAVFSVPSGNFGNLCAGLIAQRMGAPIAHFIASTNVNDVVPEYLKTGQFQSRKSIATISNAMDVGNPSNFWRMASLYDQDLERMRKDISGYAFSDEATRAAMQEIFRRYQYLIDPHGAVGYLGWKAYSAEIQHDIQGIVVETAHPAKFVEVVEETLHMDLEIPRQLKEAADKPKLSIKLPAVFEALKAHLLHKK
ncbi:MAG: threonine synthase [Saprospirales bacterium]|nr:threonine synthase [Saprospirales bacterium]